VSLSQITDNFCDLCIAIDICNSWIVDNECNSHVTDVIHDLIKYARSLNIFSHELIYFFIYMLSSHKSHFLGCHSNFFFIITINFNIQVFSMFYFRIYIDTRVHKHTNTMSMLKSIGQQTNWLAFMYELFFIG